MHEANGTQRHRRAADGWRQLLILALVGAVVVGAHFASQGEAWPDFRRFEAGPERKAAFFSVVEPMLARKNARVLEQRRRLERIAGSGRVGWLDRWWLRRMGRVYGLEGVEAATDRELIDRLMIRVDAVPVALGLAQAAKESGWGTSRFAREGNNLFGEWCYQPGCGLEPRDRAPGRRHEVRAFDSPAASVHSYVENLNTHDRYRDFRDARARARAEGREPSGHDLARHLGAYSQRREAYTREVQQMIRSNGLETVRRNSEVANEVAVEKPQAATKAAGQATEREKPGSAAILLYHHVADGTPASTSVTPEVFEQHLEYLETEGYRVLPLTEVIEAVEDGADLPERSVAITFDDAYRSVYTEALPRLERRGWPFTVFATTDYLDAGAPVYMDWAQLVDLERRGGSVGNHGTDHAHLVRRLARESERAWERRVRADIEQAQRALERRLDRPLRLFAYPYGEFDRALEELVEDIGYVGLGQHSGPVGPGSNLQALPRFPVAADYAGIESLADKLNSRPLPVKVLSPLDRILEPGAPPPLLRLELGEGAFDPARIRCFVGGRPMPDPRLEGGVLALRAKEPLPPGRSKYTCTAPARDAAGVYYWYSHLWLQPKDDGSWYEG